MQTRNLQLKTIISICLILLLGQVSLQALAGIFRMTEQQEIRVGAQAAAQVEKKNRILSNPYIEKIGQQLVAKSGRPNIQYRFRVVDSKEINAFALPGGFIYINRGLIQAADTENELVGVMAHEIGHVVAKHSVNQMERSSKAQLGLTLAQLALSRSRGGATIFNGAQMLTQGVFLKFSRDQERQADRLGAENMHSAGWNAKGLVTFFENVAKKGQGNTAFFSSHPSPSERVRNVSDLTQSWGGDGVVNTNDFNMVKAKLAEM
jgi:predicted Zn-dependent protease